VRLLLYLITLSFVINIIACMAPSHHTPANKIGKVVWQFEGLNQLSSAKDIAREKGLFVLVGLSGSSG
jgi:hypothetical protein